MASFSAIGGTKTTDGAYTVHKFTSSGQLVCIGTTEAEVLVIAGGGGGGKAEPNGGGDGGGGGGAGGYVWAPAEILNGTIEVTVGNGGAGSTANANKGTSGQDSVFGGIRAKGGGGGGSDNDSPTTARGYDGGSGGGAANTYNQVTNGSNGVVGQGYGGGAADDNTTSRRGGSGGGGAGGAGVKRTSGTGGAGGPGLNSDIVLRGTNVGYCGGGGGGGCAAVGGTATHGGGAGGTYDSAGSAGTANTGGGGGGGTSNGGNGGQGGSGIVVVRYLTQSTATRDIGSARKRIVRVGNQPFAVDGTGPFKATNVQLGGVMPGGHASASFQVPVENAYLTPYHALREGEWVVVYDDAHELYEGEILSIRPSVQVNGQHVLNVDCGGLLAVAGKRGDVSKMWVHRGGEGWQRAPGNDRGEFMADNNCIMLRAAKGMTDSMYPGDWTQYGRAHWFLDDGLSDQYLTGWSMALAWDVQVDGSGRGWVWRIDAFAGPTPNCTYYGTVDQQSNNTNTYDDLTFVRTLPVGTRCLALLLYCTSSTLATLDADRYIKFTRFDIYGTESLTKPRIDEAMVSLATRPGLATSSYSESVGDMLDDLRVGAGLSKTTVAAGLDTLAKLHAQPLDWGFWDERKFYVTPPSSAPPNDAQVVVVGGGNPGLVSWDVAEYDEDVPQYACVMFGNKDSNLVPEGAPRVIYRPTTPPYSHDIRVVPVDYSNLILSDATARALGDNIVARTTGQLPVGAVFDATPARAHRGARPGNNVAPTSQYREIALGANGNLTGYVYTTTSGWAGSGTPSDPAALVGDGNGDYVSFGDMDIYDMGTGAFTVAAWFRCDTINRWNPLLCKRSADGLYKGWMLGVSDTNRLYAWVCQDYTQSQFLNKIGTTPIVAGTWYHAAMVYAGSGGQITVYLNGNVETCDSYGSTGAWNMDNTQVMRLQGM